MVNRTKNNIKNGTGLKSIRENPVLIHQGKVIANKVHILKSEAEKVRGLILRKEPRLDEIFLFVFRKSKRWAFHMWFMRYPIDIMWLDENFVIVDIIEGFKPFKYWKPKKQSKYVIESRKGFIKKNKIKIGDFLTLRLNNSFAV